MRKKVKVKREIKGQRERTFTKIITNSFLGLIPRIKIEWKLLLPFQTSTKLLPTIKANLQMNK
jgi:hypothetical protein